MDGNFTGLSLSEARRALVTMLEAIMEYREAENISKLAMEYVTRLTPVELALHAGEPLSDFESAQLAKMTNRLLKNEPIQYIIGEADWGGLTLNVSPSVLIPRPETAQLVDIITDRWDGRSDLRILDVCTGSGCIAVALGMRLKFADVTAIDISPSAIDVARENAKKYKVNITFETQDALSLHLKQRYDIIVSNPPYIAEDERKSMGARVLDYEPGLALFVPDDDPLRFYRAIIKAALEALAPGGALYFEINPLYVKQLRALASEIFEGRNVDVIRDLYGRERFLTIE